MSRDILDLGVKGNRVEHNGKCVMNQILIVGCPLPGRKLNNVF